MLLPGSQLCGRLSSPPAGREQEAAGAGPSCPLRRGGPTKHTGCPPAPAADPGLRWGREEARRCAHRRPRKPGERERRCAWPVALHGRKQVLPRRLGASREAERRSQTEEEGERGGGGKRQAQAPWKCFSPRAEQNGGAGGAGVAGDGVKSGCQPGSTGMGVHARLYSEGSGRGGMGGGGRGPPLLGPRSSSAS